MAIKRMDFSFCAQRARIGVAAALSVGGFVAHQAQATLFAEDLISQKLFEIDPTTFTVDPITTYTNTGISGLAGDELSGQLYAVDRETDQLYRIDPGTEALTTIGPLGVDIAAAGLAADRNTGKLYMSDYVLEKLFEIDPQTGTATEIGSGTVGAQGLAFDPHTNTLYAARGTGSNVSGTRGLYTIDTTTAVATFIGDFGFTVGNNGLTFDPTTNTLYLIDNQQDWLITVDTTTGSARALTGGYLSPKGIGNGTALAYLPEPGSMGLLAFGSALVLRRRRA